MHVRFLLSLLGIFALSGGKDIRSDSAPAGLDDPANQVVTRWIDGSRPTVAQTNQPGLF